MAEVLQNNYLKSDKKEYKYKCCINGGLICIAGGKNSKLYYKWAADSLTGSQSFLKEQKYWKLYWKQKNLWTVGSWWPFSLVTVLVSVYSRSLANVSKSLDAHSKIRYDI